MNAIVAEDSKKKKKKQKTKKETMKKTVDSDDSLKELAMATLAPSVGLNATPTTPEMQGRPSAEPQKKEKKAKKKKKRKHREGKNRKSEDSEASGEDEEDKTKQLNVDIVAPETKRRASVLPDETRRTKKQKETTSRRNSEIPGPAGLHRNQETNGGFVQSVKSLKMNSLTVAPEKKRRKSLVIEDMESKSETSEERRRRKSLSPEIHADLSRPGADQNVTGPQPKSISAIPTGYKSPRLIIKPSYHQY